MATQLTDEEIKKLYLEELLKRGIQNPTPYTIDEEAWADWAGGLISDRVYTVMTGKPCKTERL